MSEFVGRTCELHLDRSLLTAGCDTQKGQRNLGVCTDENRRGNPNGLGGRSLRCGAWAPAVSFVLRLSVLYTYQIFPTENGLNEKLVKAAQFTRQAHSPGPKGRQKEHRLKDEFTVFDQ